MTESEVLAALYQGQTAKAETLADAKGENITLFEAAALGRARDVAVLLQMRRELALDFTPLHLAAERAQASRASSLNQRGEGLMSPRRGVLPVEAT